ncbi:MAG: tetratricopeptide repeat protein [Ignavibacteriae bacterium]|nr:tetratricopeptide repeat protein [Ignavibacteriota bacterium]
MTRIIFYIIILFVCSSVLSQTSGEYLNKTGVMYSQYSYKSGLDYSAFDAKKEAFLCRGAAQNFKYVPDIYVYIKNGGVNILPGNFSGAFSVFSETGCIDTSDYHEYINRGSLFIEKYGDIVSALSDYNRAVEINPNDTTYASRGNVYFRYVINYEKAVADLTRAININPNPEYYLTRGRVYEQLKDYTNAVSDYSAAVNSGFGNVPVYYMERGMLYSYLKEYKKAIFDFTKVIEFSPETKVVYFERGLARYHSLDTQGAVSDWMTGKEFGDIKADYALYVLGLFETALEYLRENPNDALILFTLGDTYSYLFNDYNKAFSYLNKAIKVNPGDAPAYFARSNVYQYLKEYNKAAADLSNSINLVQSDYNYYKFRAGTYMKLKEYKKAVSDYDKAVSLNPEDVDSYFFRGISKYKTGDFEGSRKDLIKAKKTGFIWYERTFGY